MPTQAKVESIAALREQVGTARTAVLTEYRGLSVRQLSDLRRQLKATTSEYKVVKNRLARLAVKESGLEPLAGHLKGPTGLVIAREDPVAMARALQAFARTNPAFTIKLGLVEGQVVDAQELRSLAELPPKEALRSQLLGAIQGPLSQLVSLLTAAHRDLAYVLKVRSEQVSEERRDAPERQTEQQQEAI